MERLKNIQSRLPLVLGAACLIAAATPSFAEYSVNPDVVLNYSAADADTPAGAAALLARIEAAAAEVCAPARLVKRCRQHVTALAVSRLDRPQLNAVYASRAGAAGVALAASAR